MNALETSRILHDIFEIVFLCLVLGFILHALMLAYHWFTYGDSQKLSTTALTTYLVGGGILLLTMRVAISTF